MDKAKTQDKKYTLFMIGGAVSLALNLILLTVVCIAVFTYFLDFVMFNKSLPSVCAQVQKQAATATELPSTSTDLFSQFCTSTGNNSAQK